MTIIFMDGFDKYGDLNSMGGGYVSLNITQGEWTTAGTNCSINPPLSSSGYSLSFTNILAKTLSANYSRLIAGVRIKTDLTGNTGIVFVDVTTAQCTVGIQASTGYICIWTGTFNTVIYQSSTAITANTTHYLECDITFAGGGTGTYSLYLDGVLLHTGNATTIQSADAYANVVQLYATSYSYFDDFYLFSSAGTINNAPLLTNPRIQTDYPTSDHQTQLSNIATVVGVADVSPFSQNASANNLYLRAAVPAVNCTLNAVHFIPIRTQPTGTALAGIYAYTGGTSVGTLLCTGSVSTGFVSNTACTLPLPNVSVTAGSTYWIGVMFSGAADMGITQSDVIATSCQYINTGTFPTLPAANTAFNGYIYGLALWATGTGATVNWSTMNQLPPMTTTYYPAGTYGVIEGVTAGTEDLYGFPTLATDIVKIYATAMKTSSKLSASGTRGISLNMFSGATDSKGSMGTAFLSTSFVWYGSYFENDPNTSTTWTRSGLNAAYGGQSISV